MADFPVKWFSSDMGGSPENGDQYGALIELLKACLVTGFNTKPVASLTYDSAIQQATASVGSGHGYLKWQVIAISGADQAGYNGEHRVTAIGSDWVRFALDTAPAATEATGDLIEIKAAPVEGWEVAAEDAETYRIAFRRTDPRATALTLIVKNGDPKDYYSSTPSSAKLASVLWASDFIDLDTYTVELGRYWPYSNNETNRDAEWLFIADALGLYYINRYADPAARGLIISGDFDSVRPGDAFNCISNGISASASWTFNDAPYPASMNFGNTSYLQICRSYNQLPGDAHASLLGIGERMGETIGYPNASDNGYYVSLGRLLIREGPSGDTSSIRAEQSLRGYLPGILQPLQTSPVYDKVIIDNLPGLEGVPVLSCLVANEEDDSQGHLVAFRLDEWRGV
ncbi:hypothetical protein FLM52_14500 [bacterium Scap17]|nr:hypothetical protein [bacterium Scap17]